MLDQPNSDFAVFLDVDGTLVDIADTPDSIAVPTGLVAMLTRLSASLDGALAILTGRPIADVDRLFAPLRTVIAGVHGSELRLVPDEPVRRTAGEIDPELIEAIRALAESMPGLIVEPKGTSIAVHYRADPAAGPHVAAALLRLVEERWPGLALRQGRKVLELVPREISKGAAMELILRLAPFRGRKPLMIGDDITDETAFEVVERLGGRALRVAGEHYPRSAADFDDPEAVRTWLATLSERLAA